jgi:hypothetical protein
MDHITPQPVLTDAGVIFTVRVDSLDRECLVSKDALEKLSTLKSETAVGNETMDIFHAFEATINGIARRLVAARVPGTPLVMTPNSFVSLVR